MEKHIDVCFKRWARVTEPNDNLVQAYLQKARHDLVVLRSIPKEDTEWKAAVAYYTRYHMMTALLLKVGVECKDHNCSLKIAKYLFSDVISSDLFIEIKESKRQRIDLQYYTDRIVKKEEFEHNMEGVDAFVEIVQDLIESLTREDIGQIRKKLE